MLDCLPDAIREAASDPAVRVIVLSGAGERAFSAGADLGGAFDPPPGEQPTLEQGIDELQRRQESSWLLHTVVKPTIAAINGAAAGASLSMAFACDFRLAAAGAPLRTAFAGIGFSGDFGSSWFLTKMVGSARARELMLLGERITAEEALAAGLVHRVFPREEFRKQVDAFAARLAEGPPLAYRYMKRNINLAESGAHLREILDLEAEGQSRTGRSEDLRRASKAFLAKQKPRFEGR
jgi:2-(1,2-epoxy-1,2-dihydrophenyl)acetyl-CoA isomerase